MKKLTRIISSVAAFSFALGLTVGCGKKEAKDPKPAPAPTVLTCAKENELFCFVENADGTLELARYWKPAGNDMEVSIPAQFEGKNVTSIGSSAFMVYESKYSMNLNTAEFQGEFMEQLKRITLPEGIKVIKSEAFKGIANLSALNIPLSVTTIETGAFQDTAWKTSNVANKCTISFANPNPAAITEHDILGYQKNGEKRIARTDFGTGVQVRFEVPAAAVDAYKTAWPDYAHIIASYWDYTV